MDKPFIALFARNETPLPGHSFVLATPIRENAFSNRGEFRLDYTSAQTVTVADVLRFPWLLKTLTVGTALDVEIVQKLQGSFGANTVGKTWAPPFSGNGFKLKPRDADHKAPKWLLNLPYFEVPADGNLPAFETLKTFKEVHGESAPERPRVEEIYQAPLLLIPETPGEDRSTRKSFFSRNQSLCYNQSIYGYSVGKHPDPEIHLSLLHLLAHSQLFRYWCLVCSSRIGASWRTFLKEDLDAFPFPDFTRIPEAQRLEIAEFARALDAGLPSDWQPLDTFIYKLYCMTDDEAEVVKDTVTFHSPYRTSRVPAEQPPTPPELDAFCTRLEALLQPLFTLTQQDLKVNMLPPVSDGGIWLPPWRFATISLSGQSKAVTATLIARVMRAATTTSASRIIVRVPGGGLILGLLNQRRFWSLSRARLCAVEVAREHSDWFPILPGTSRARRGSHKG